VMHSLVLFAAHLSVCRSVMGLAGGGSVKQYVDLTSRTRHMSGYRVVSVWLLLVLQPLL
jgi:hypothetical protein